MFTLLQPAAGKVVSIETFFPLAAEVTAALVNQYQYQPWQEQSLFIWKWYLWTLPCEAFDSQSVTDR